MKLLSVLLIINTTVFAQNSQKRKTGEEIEGHFIGNRKKILATTIKTREQIGNPVENGTSAEYEIHFSDKKLKPIKMGCCEITLINEGDLDKNGADDLSVFQAPMNGCSYSMTTYSFINGNWKQIVKPFLIPTGCSELSNAELQSRIFLQNKRIYYYETLSDDDSGELSLKKTLAK